MSNANIFSKLEIPQTIAAGPGPGNTDERDLAAFANAGLADHMHADVLRGMIECKKMLRDVWGTGKIGRAHVRTPVTSQSRMPSSA